MLTLEYTNRELKTSPGTVRGGGHLPAIFYGPKEKSTPISVKAIDFKKVWKDAGESSIITLKGPKGEEHEALIYDVDLHPVSDIPRHADFYVVEKGKKLKVEVSLEFTGTSPAVKDLGGTLVKVLHSVEIEALPKDLPREIIVDIAPLATLESQILAGQLPLPTGVVLITGPEEVVAAITVAKEEVEEPTKSISDIEVVGAKGKEEVEGEGAEAGKADAGKGDAKAEKKPAGDKK